MRIRTSIHLLSSIAGGLALLLVGVASSLDLPRPNRREPPASARTPHYVDPPRYLGAALGSATITPNGDGSNDRWTPTFPFSKAVPTCAITIRSGTTVVRTLNCATSTGRAVLSWDARNSAGKLVAKGKYQWTMTGRDADGPLRWWTGSTAPITSTVTVA
jgi:hypothetical protein